MTALFLIVWEATCGALFWSIFCRSVKVDQTTRLDVRLALWLVGIASLLGLGAPLYGWVPNLPTLVIVGSVVILQVVMAQHWHSGVPYQFIDPRYRPRRRAADVNPTAKEIQP